MFHFLNAVPPQKGAAKTLFSIMREPARAAAGAMKEAADLGEIDRP